jgi:hypothetical protein
MLGNELGEAQHGGPALISLCTGEAPGLTSRGKAGVGDLGGWLLKKPALLANRSLDRQQSYATD